MSPAPDPSAEIARLETQLRELKAAWAEFEHQARRYRDAAERAGGILGRSEMDARQLYRNLADNEAEQARLEERLARHKSDLAAKPDTDEDRSP